MLYSKGVNLYNSANYGLAAECFRKAAEHGHAQAQFRIGQCYEKGEGVQQDYSKAAEWYRRAARQGNAEARRKLSDWNLK